MYKDKIIKAVAIGDIYGFTSTLKGEQKRYIVAYTNNGPNVSAEILNKQALKYSYDNDNINVGGWTDNKTGKQYIDISTSVDHIGHAKLMCKYNNQIAIYDTKEQKEIRV